MTPTDAKKPPPNRPTARETIDALRAAGGDGWDSIDDPEAFLGRKDDSDDRIADLTRRLAEAEKELNDYKDAAEVEARLFDEAREQLATCEKDRGELIAALMPFADANEDIVSHVRDDVTVRYAVQTSSHPEIDRRLLVLQFRRAAALLSRLDNGGAA